MTQVDVFDGVFGLPENGKPESSKSADGVTHIARFSGVTFFTTRERLAELHAAIGAHLEANPLPVPVIESDESYEASAALLAVTK